MISKTDIFNNNNESSCTKEFSKSRNLGIIEFGP